MNREIEFRGLRTDGQGWVYGAKYNDFIISYLEVEKFLEESDLFSCNAVIHEVIPESMGQFTGLLDKNGLKIFEGDIISSHHFYDQCGKEYFLNHIIKWSDQYCGWFAFNSGSKNEIDGCIQLFVYIKNAVSQVIIGNIHENKQDMEKHTLKSMTDFVLEQGMNPFQNDVDAWIKTHKYAIFLKQPLNVYSL